MAQAKRIQAAFNVSMVANTENVSAVLEVPTVPREEVNFHNIWGSVALEPENADANALGNWVLYIVKEGGQVIDWTFTTINAENNNWFIIACGVWAASNQTPFTKEVHPSTSRTLNPGDKIVMSATVTSLTAGQVTGHAMLCAHTTRK